MNPWNLTPMQEKTMDAMCTHGCHKISARVGPLASYGRARARGEGDGAVSNPWGLPPATATAMDAICDHGSHKAAARALGLSVTTIATHARIASERMGATNAIGKYVQWDRARRAAEATP